MALNHTKAGHYVITAGKLFTPIVPSGAEGWLNQLTPGTVGASVATPGKSFTCVAQVYSAFHP